MQLQRSNSFKYVQFLKVKDYNYKKLHSIESEQDNIIWKCLLAVAQAQKVYSNTKAVHILKIARNRLQIMQKLSINQSSLSLYNIVNICLMANLISRLIIIRQFAEARALLRQIKINIRQMKDLRQVLIILFGVQSLVAIKNYDVFSNLQFKYGSQTQAPFLLILGQIKLALGQQAQANIALQKFIQLRTYSQKNNDILDLKVCYLLAKQSPNKYKQKYEDIKRQLLLADKDNNNNNNNNCAIINNMEQYLKISKQLIVQLYAIQTKLQQQQQQILKDSRIQHMGYLRIYANHLLQTNHELIQKQQYCILVNQLKQQNNTVIVRELEKTRIFRQAVSFCQSKISTIAAYVLRMVYTVALDKIIGRKSVIKVSQKQYKQQALSKISHKSGLKRANLKQPQNKNQAHLIVELLMKGDYILKINFGTKGSHQKYLALTDKDIRWAPQKSQINDSFSNCKYKHIIGIVYGKVTQNINKKKYDDLQPWKCFSLITQDRSYDFYCEQQKNISFWLQGISYSLQLYYKNPQKYPFYSKGRALWKMVLLRMQSKYLKNETNSVQDPKNKSKIRYKNSNIRAILKYKQHLMKSQKKFQ